MNSSQVRTIPTAVLILFYIARTPSDTRSFTTKEITLLDGIKKKAYSGTAVCCRSENQARQQLRTYISQIEEEARKPQEKNRLPEIFTHYRPAISYPIMARMEIAHIYARGDYFLLIVRELDDANVPNITLESREKYYFVFDLQPTVYRNLLDRISKRPL